jgi:vancomycin resistance protein VanW
MNNTAIQQKPRTRSTFRRRLGREFYILRRKLADRKNRDWAAATGLAENALPSIAVIQHRSVLLRKLKAVDMHLQHNKIRNLQLALERTGTVLIKPGETYSFWRLVGRPTRRKGYLEGLVLEQGKVRSDTGGGVCQLGNLIYWMLLHTSLTVTERWRHGYDVFPDVNREIPFGCGATLSYNYIDLRFRNDTSRTYLLKLWLDNEFLHGEIRSDADEAHAFKVVETDHCFETLWWGGYRRCNKIWRQLTDKESGKEHTEFITGNQAIVMYEPLLSEGNQ